jgi:hypothetical protein
MAKRPLFSSLERLLMKALASEVGARPAWSRGGERREGEGRCEVRRGEKEEKKDGRHEAYRWVCSHPVCTYIYIY